MRDRNDTDEDGAYHYRIRFQKADKNKDGLISYQELMALLRSCNNECSEAELQDYVNEVEIDENGNIGEEAFLQIIEKIQQENDTEDELAEAFKIFDINNTGAITPNNVLAIFSKIDDTIKEEEVLQMFKECDLDKDGYLNFKEFSRMIKNK